MEKITSFHMHATKSYLLQAIDANGGNVKNVLLNSKATREDVVNSPYKYFTFGNCDNTGKDGDCKGHKKIK